MPNPNNPFLAHLNGEVVSVAADRAEWFESCLRSIMGHKHSDDFMAQAEQMASSEDDGFWPPKDDWRANYRPYVVKGGVLHIPVMGVLLNRFPWQLGHWATGYTYIERALKRGLADEDVTKIAFICDSPGGEVAGNFELVDRIFEARGQKPMRAFAADRAYSAAYSIASAADDITVTRTGGVGSIGVYTMHIDYSDALAQAGIKITFIKAGARKTDGNSYERLAPRAKARMQVRIDRLMDIFVSTVSRNRGLEEQAIRDFEADCFSADEALEIGLADKIEIFEDAVVAFTEDGSTSEDGDGDMTTQNQNAAKDAPKTFSQADLDAAVAKALGDRAATDTSQAVATALAADKARRDGILACEPAKKRPQAAAAAAETDMTVEQATAFLAKLPEEKASEPASGGTQPKGGALGQLFRAGMENTANPEVGTEAGGGSEAAANTDEDMAKQILADHAAHTGFGEKKAKAA